MPFAGGAKAEASITSEDTISVTVTSRNGTAQKTYTVKFVKEEVLYSVTVNSNSGKIFASVDGEEKSYTYNLQLTLKKTVRPSPTGSVTT